MKLDEFLTRNRIGQEAWERAAIDWRLLEQIAADHQEQQERLRDTAELFARVIQRLPAVHSVRWRVKNTEHLLEKIIRKRADNNEKYSQIDDKNYFELVTDLVGIRALHLFKDECFSIDTDLRAMWVPAETPTAYVRDGDPQNLTVKFREHNFEVKSHPEGYRSVHYVCTTQPLQRKVFVEIQVRTIFEEGWSEIDHRVRYPNFSDDQLVSYFLTIFNRLAGSADEMGTFVQGLTGALQASGIKLVEANRQKEEALSAMDVMIGDLEKIKKQDSDTSKRLAALQEEVAKLRRISKLDYAVNPKHPNALTALVGLDTLNALSKYNLDSPASEAIKRLLDGDGKQNDILKKLLGND